MPSEHLLPLELPVAKQARLPPSAASTPQEGSVEGRRALQVTYMPVRCRVTRVTRAFYSTWQKLLFDGRTLSDDETLTELRAGPEGASRLYHDGELVLEFESPAMPEILRKIRSGEVKVGGAKSKGKGGKGGGKGKKGKKKK